MSPLGILLLIPGILSAIPKQHQVRDSNGVIVENDNDVCDGMCHSNYSDVLEECRYGCHHRTGIRQQVNPFQSCLGSCESRFRANFDKFGNETDFINRAWEACLHACRLPYKTKIRWNVYIDLRSGEPIWNFERIVSDGHRISSEALEYQDLISTIVLRKHNFFMDPSSKLRFPNLNVYDADNRAMQAIMTEMLQKVRQELSSVSPRRFDGISSIDYVGPRVVENGPNGPVVKDITELQYSPKEVIIYKGVVFKMDDLLDQADFREQHFTLMGFMIIMMVSVLVCACAKLRSQWVAYKATRVRRYSNCSRQSDDWTKRIPTTGDAPPCYSPREDRNSVKLIVQNTSSR
ncbi:Protein CBG00559 [Caenorhabditis briggsae]|uniref:Uncharacterized protein n=3 Tax=Caenorhabditis briggsae TaxID=6238 RepID=A0AAE9ISY3_CAEBR|nr:Protein CBG00559 [Caenorhabditis briggsae]ULU04578.1 hypothetical protein L3Y34_017382 [Caenorhabditis briggsae]CAP22067.2 Protein CBG00559 [Caenorhabditis briggsae]